MNVPLRAVAEGRAEMAFWPVLAALFTYHTTRSWIDMLLIGVFIVSAGQTYILLRNVSQVAEKQQGRRATRRRNSRPGTTPESGLMESTTDAILELMPGGTKTKASIVASVLVEFFGGIAIWIRLLMSVNTVSSASVSTLGVLVIPVLYLSTLGARIVWSR